MWPNSGEITIDFKAVIAASLNKQAVGRQFDMPGLESLQLRL